MRHALWIVSLAVLHCLAVVFGFVWTFGRCFKVQPEPWYCAVSESGLRVLTFPFTEISPLMPLTSLAWGFALYVAWHWLARIRARSNVSG